MESKLKTQRKRTVKNLRIGIVVGALLLAGASASDVQVNFTNSAPHGFWEDKHKAPERGDYVVFCLPMDAEMFKKARSRGNLPVGHCQSGFAPIAKPVVGFAGDVIEVGPTGVSVNGALLPASRPNSEAVYDAWPYGTYTLEEGQMWVMGAHPQSFDSRYYGPVDDYNVESVIAPLWVW